MSSEGALKENAPAQATKGEAFKQKEVLEHSAKKHAYISASRTMHRKEAFALLSGFKKKWARNLLGALRKLLG